MLDAVDVRGEGEEEQGGLKKKNLYIQYNNKFQFNWYMGEGPKVGNK